MLPGALWNAHQMFIYAIGRNEAPGDADVRRLAAFLSDMGLVNGRGEKLTVLGEEYFQKAFVLEDTKDANSLIRDRLMHHPVVILVCQVFYGRGTVHRAQLENLLRSQRLTADQTGVGRLLGILNKFGVLRYSKKTGSFCVLESVKTDQAQPPRHVFLPADTPFSNVQRLRELLSRASGNVIWLDKHFDRKALPLLADAADGHRVCEITIVSGPYNVDTPAKTEAGLLRKELHAKGIMLKWLVVQPGQLRDVHDRWIVCDDWAFNVPPVNSLFSAQAAEMLESADPDQARQFVSSVAARGAAL